MIIAAAGSGKTTYVVRESCGASSSSAALVTYTLNGRDELRSNAYRNYSHIPAHVDVSTWYRFLLRNFIRPFQGCLEATRISGLNFVTHQSTRYVKEVDTRRFYFTSDMKIHSDKASQFACKVIEVTDGAPIDRIERIYCRLYLDECQDLAGYDLDLVEHLLKSKVQVELVGDYRQTTFQTHAPRRNSQFKGPKIVDKFEEWESDGLCEIKHENHSRRCVQEICDFADQMHPDAPNTNSLNKEVTGHDGIFAVRKRDVEKYCHMYDPQPLRYDRRTACPLGDPINFGASKGMTFERTLIYPHRKLHTFLQSGDLDDAGSALEKIYVAITRARQSVAFVVEDDAEITGMRAFEG